MKETYSKKNRDGYEKYLLGCDCEEWKKYHKSLKKVDRKRNDILTLEEINKFVSD